MKCAKCGYENSATAKFCINCGSSLILDESRESAQSQTAQTQQAEKIANNQVPPLSEDLSNSSPLHSVEDEVSANVENFFSGKRAAIIGGVILIVVAAVFAYQLAPPKNKKPDQEEKVDPPAIAKQQRPLSEVVVGKWQCSIGPFTYTYSFNDKGGGVVTLTADPDPSATTPVGRAGLTQFGGYQIKNNTILITIGETHSQGFLALGLPEWSYVEKRYDYVVQEYSQDTWVHQGFVNQKKQDLLTSCKRVKPPFNPSYSDYKVEVFKGPYKAPNSELGYVTKTGPNLAGKYYMDGVPCGGPCRTDHIYDLSTGEEITDLGKEYGSALKLLLKGYENEEVFPKLYGVLDSNLVVTEVALGHLDKQICKRMFSLMESGQLKTIGQPVLYDCFDRKYHVYPPRVESSTAVDSKPVAPQTASAQTVESKQGVVPSAPVGSTGDGTNKSTAAVPASASVGSAPINQALPLLRAMLNGSAANDERAIQAAMREIESLPKPARGDRKMARQLNDEGLRALKGNDYAGAINSLSKARATDLLDQEIPSNLGYAYLQAGRLTDAEQAIYTSLTLAPTRASSWGTLGVITAKQGNQNTAVAAFLNAYRFTSSQQKTREYLQKLAQEDTDPQVRTAAGKALNTSLLATSTGGQASTVSPPVVPAVTPTPAPAAPATATKPAVVPIVPANKEGEKTSKSTALTPAPKQPESKVTEVAPLRISDLDGDWMGSYSCGGAIGSGNSPSAKAFSINVLMSVRGGQARLVRESTGSVSYEEKLSGVIATNLSVLLKGTGMYRNTPSQNWNTSFNGKFSRANDKALHFDADGAIFSASGEKRRECKVNLARLP